LVALEGPGAVGVDVAVSHALVEPPRRVEAVVVVEEGVGVVVAGEAVVDRGRADAAGHGFVVGEAVEAAEGALRMIK